MGPFFCDFLHYFLHIVVIEAEGARNGVQIELDIQLFLGCSIEEDLGDQNDLL